MQKLFLTYQKRKRRRAAVRPPFGVFTEYDLITSHELRYFKAYLSQRQHLIGHTTVNAGFRHAVNG